MCRLTHVRIIMSCAERAAYTRKEKKQNTYKALVGTSKKRDHLKDLRVSKG